MNGGADSVGWTPDIWSGLNKAIHDEVQRTAVATTFIPIVTGASTATTAPADVINLASMTVDPSAVVPIVELSIGFALTQQQVDDEAQHAVANMLATRGANFVAQVEDLLIFQGGGADRNRPLNLVQVRGAAGEGLLAAASSTVDVASAGVSGVYGEHTFDAVVDAITSLRSRGQAGPYALALASAVYADTFVPVRGTLIMAADQIRPLVTAGFVDAPALPGDRGLLISLGGGTIDLVMAVEPTLTFVQVDDQGMSQFRIYERWALRIKDPDSIVRFEFETDD